MTASAAVEAGTANLAAGAASPVGGPRALPSARAAGGIANSAQSAASAAKDSVSSGAAVESFQARWQSMLAVMKLPNTNSDANIDADLSRNLAGSSLQQASTNPASASPGRLSTGSSSSAAFFLKSAPPSGKTAAEPPAPANESAADMAGAERSSALVLQQSWAGGAALQAPDSSAASAASSAGTRSSQRAGAHESAPHKTTKEPSSTQPDSAVQAAALAGNPLLAVAVPANAPVAPNSASVETNPGAATGSTANGLWTSRSQSAPFHGHPAAASIPSRNLEAGPSSSDAALSHRENAALPQSPAEEPPAAQQTSLDRSNQPASGKAESYSFPPQTHNFLAQPTAAQSASPDAGTSRAATQNTAADAAGNSASASSITSRYPAAADDKKAVAGRVEPSSLSSSIHAAATASPEHGVSSQSATASLDAAAQSRGQAELKSSAGTAAPSSAAASPDSHDPFAELDSGTTPASPSWIRAGAHSAEAGYQDPSLGWVGVRAEVSGGDIHASLVPGSADAAQVLSSHLAGLNSYLAEQHAPVATLTMSTSAESQRDAGAGQGAQQQEQNHGSGAQTQPATAAPASTAAARTAATADSDSGPIETVNPASRYVSVMA